MEYKFRGYDIIGNKWVYGDLAHNQKVTKTGLQPRTMVGGYEVDPESVGIWTGAKDKHGVDIYVGDIVDISLSNEITQATVVFDEESYKFACRYEYNGDTFNLHILSFNDEVIGNIYERDHHKKEDSPILDKKLVDCGLSVRALGVCKWNGIETLRGLTQISKIDFLKLRNCGKTTLAEVDDLIQKYNLNWKPTL